MHHFLKTMAKYTQQIDSQFTFQMGHKQDEQEGQRLPRVAKGW